jgi:transposase
MDRDLLERYLAEGLSLSEIGVLVDRDPSTIGYWVKKHGLVANGHDRHAPKGGLPHKKLERLVRAGATLEAIAQELDSSISTVRYWIVRYGLPRPYRVRREDIELALSSGARTIRRRCRRHGETDFVIENSGRTRCRLCRMDRVAAWRRRAKQVLVREAGGQCHLCGYDRCLAALEFHHLDPREKAFALSLRGVTRSLDALREEAAKCVLLCANCHAEVELGFSKVG